MVKVTNKIIGACIAMMMEQYNKRNKFTLEGVLFTKEEIIKRANTLFPRNARVKKGDMKPSSLHAECLQKGSDDSLAEYFRLCSPDEENFSDLTETFENEEVLKVLKSHLPRQYSDEGKFVEAYYQFVSELVIPPQEQKNLDSREAVWIAAATLTYNEYIRTEANSLRQYAFDKSAIVRLANRFVLEQNLPKYSSHVNICTKDYNDARSPFLLCVIDNKRRIAQADEVDNSRQNHLTLDFKVNTINGTVSVRELVEFIDQKYATFVNDCPESPVEEMEPQIDSCVIKEQFLRDVYMDSDDYEKLIALISRKKNIILQGAPGVGKTFCAKRLAYAFMGEEAKERVLYVQFHQGYSYEDFVEGYRPTKDGYSLEKGVFYNFCVDAGEDLDNQYFFIIDEMNRGNLSKIFGELFTLLEAGKRGDEVKLVYSGECFTIPENVYLIGLMNTADRSLAMIDYALRRRFGFYTMKPGFDTAGFRRYKEEFDSPQFDRLIEQIKMLNEDISKDDSLGEGFCIGHSFFCDLHRESIVDELSSIVDNEILELLGEYWFDEPDKVKEWSKKLRGALQ